MENITQEDQYKKLDLNHKCDEHSTNCARLTLMEEKLSVVEANTKVVDKLSAKVSLLLTIMSFTIVLVFSGVLYTQVGISNFKEMYNEQRIELGEKVTKTNKEDRDFILNEFRILSTNLDGKINELSRKITILETTISRDNK